MSHLQNTDFSEPYSSVSFQHKPLTSPYPYSNSEPMFPKKNHVARWLRLHQKTLSLLTVFLLFLLYCFRDVISIYSTFIRIKMNNTKFDRGYVACRVLRKEPMLFVQDTEHVQVVWEMDCGMADTEMVLSYWHSPTDKIHIAPIKPNILDPYHTVYKATIGPLKEGGQITYSLKYIQNKSYKSYQLAQYNFHWFSNVDTWPIRIAAIADNQFGMLTFSTLLRQIRKLPNRRQPHLLLHAGDAVQNYPSLRQWDTDFVAPLTVNGLAQKMPMIYAHGNHDYDPRGEYTYTRSHQGGDPWFAFSMSNGAIRFIVLDSNVDWETQDQWLRNEIETPEFKQAQFRIALVHVPPFLEYWEPEAWFQKNQSEWGAFIKDRYVPLFESSGMDLVISGHQHNYERGERKGVHYAIIGGGGGDLDFEQVKDWGMYEAKLLDFHFVLLEFLPPSDPSDPYDPWTLRWDTYNAKGKIVDTMLIESQARKRKNKLLE